MQIKIVIVILVLAISEQSYSQVILNGMSSYRGGFGLPMPSDTPILDLINAWQAQTNLVRVAGVPTVGFTTATNFGSASTGLTYINGVGNAITNNCIQDGYIKSVTCSLAQIGSGQQIKFKVFRFDGTNFYNISESEVIPISGSTGTRTFTLTNSMLAQPGDQLGLWMNGSDTGGNQVLLNGVAVSGLSNILYATGDITTSNSFSTGISNYFLCLNASMNPPFIVATGDSISKGSQYNSFLDGDLGPDWNQTYWARQVLYQMRTNFYPNTIRYQTLGSGGTTTAWSSTVGVPAATNAMPRALFIHTEINDIAQGIAWVIPYNHEGSSNKWNDILLQCNTNMTVIVDEVFPDGLATSNQNWKVYQINTNLASWCALNGVVFLRSHDSMGNTAQQPFITQLLPAYSLDGIHPNTLGVSNWCFLLIQSITNGALNTHPIIPPVTSQLALSSWSYTTVGVLGDVSGRYFAGTTNVVFPFSTNINRVDFQIQAKGTDSVATNTLTCHIYTMTGTTLNIGSPVGTSATVTGSDSWASQTIVSFDFSPNVSLSASTPYAFVIDQGKVSSTAFFWVGQTSTNIASARFINAASNGSISASSSTLVSANRIYADPR